MRVIRACLCALLLISFLSAEELTPDLTVMVPMRDGVLLPTDLYYPTPENRDVPCILLRSPGGRQAHWKYFAAMAKKGYVIAIQDTRSVLDEDGKTFPFISDGWGTLQDGYDTIEWLAASPYTNGKIGTWGSSALGITQLMTAPTNPPSLCCQYIMQAAASLYHEAIFPGGQLLKHQIENWLGYYAKDSGMISYVSQRSFYNPVWHSLNTVHVADRINVPAIIYGGWYDTFIQGTLSSFKSRQEEGGPGAKGKQKLVVGPWTHFYPQDPRFGDFDMPKAGIEPPIDISPDRWFDFYLKGVDNGADKIPAVIYYVMGPFDGTPSKGNVWRTADTWPVPAVSTPYYLTSSQGLQTKVPEAGNKAYSYDPKDPIPTIGGRNLFLESGPKDQRPIESREDIIVFTSEPFADDIEVTGPLIAKLFVTSNKLDTDFVVRLCDVYPDGRSILISDGVCRLGVNCPDRNLEKPQEITIDLSSTSLVFAKGHRVRVSVSSSNYPRYEKNLNIGIKGVNKGHSHIAENKIFMGDNYPSRIILPLVQARS